jgi:catechol 2,3-dioxygenase-like lactoylglutathione lyase family enzyme
MGRAERAALERARRRLDTLDLYPRPVSTRFVRVIAAPWFFRLPWLRRFDGYATHFVILVRDPVRSDGGSDDLITHELCHVWQMQHHPIRMPLSYVTQGYDRNPYELEARAAVGDSQHGTEPPTPRWPNGLQVQRIRVARPTDQLEEVVGFYRDALGFEELGGFRDHAGYGGVFLGLPDERVHLEFTSHRDGSPCPAPTADNLLVLYADADGIEGLRARLAALGHEPIEPENPYWATDVQSVTFADPDGWRVVLVAVSTTQAGRSGGAAGRPREG